MSIPPIVEWKPTRYFIENANITKFLRKYQISTEDELLRNWIKNPEEWWSRFLEEINWFWEKEPKKIMDNEGGLPWTRWFVGGRTNLVYNALFRWLYDESYHQIPAVIYEGEEGLIKIISYGELKDQVLALSYVLKKYGIKEGDRVAIYLPFIPECVISLLAIGLIGAIAVPLFSGFGPEPIISRLRDSQAKLVITADGVVRRGRLIPVKENIDEALEKVDSVENVLLVRRAGIKVDLKENRDKWMMIETSYVPTSIFKEFEIPFFESDKVFMLIYTSGTTGKPKATVHTHTGFPIKAAQDMYFFFDMKPKWRISWITDMGWMMGPWLILGALIHGGTIVMYDGAHDFPKPDRLWELTEKHRVNVLGITPTLIRSLIPLGSEFPKIHPLHDLHLIGSTGEPWDPESWRWTMQFVGKGRVPIINYSGGTEISGGILGCFPTKPLKPASFNSVAPGIDADVWDENETPLVNEPGFLVVKNHNPGMTKSLWNDDKRYYSTYWERWKGKAWDHGDLALVDEENYWFILGRVDDTIKVGGKRLGPFELESVIIEHHAVKEAACVGVPHPIKGEVPVAFVVLKTGYKGTHELKESLMDLVEVKLGKPLALEDLYFLSDLPKTRNAKIMRSILRKALLNQDLGDLSSLMNPEIVDEIKSLLHKHAQE